MSTFAFPPETVNQLKTDLKTKDCPVDAEELAKRFEPNVAMFTVMQELEAAVYRIPQKTLMSVNNERAAELLRALKHDLPATRRDLDALAQQASALATTLEGLRALGRDALAAEGSGDIDALANAVRALAQDAQGARESFPGSGRAPGAVVLKHWLIRQLADHFEALDGRATTTKEGAFHTAAQLLVAAIPTWDGGSSYTEIRNALKLQQ